MIRTFPWRSRVVAAAVLLAAACSSAPAPAPIAAPAQTQRDSTQPVAAAQRDGRVGQCDRQRHRQPGPARRRQRGRRGHCHRLRAGGHLPDRGQHRRRRLHGDPLPGWPRHRVRLPREGAAQGARQDVPGLDGRILARPSTTTATSPSVCPARSRASRSRTRSTARRQWSRLVSPAARARA